MMKQQTAIYAFLAGSFATVVIGFLIVLLENSRFRTHEFVVGIWIGQVITNGLLAAILTALIF